MFTPIAFNKYQLEMIKYFRERLSKILVMKVAKIRPVEVLMSINRDWYFEMNESTIQRCPNFAI